MSIQIALLRGINVGGRNIVSMSDVRELFDELDFVDAKTVLQSGNVLFRNDRKSSASLEGFLETETAKRLNASVDRCPQSIPKGSEE
jgi:uncharacterized protein (DUF1697 family)